MSHRDPFRYSSHARRRAQQRAVGGDAVAAALDWGRRIHQGGGRVVFHLGRRGVELASRDGVDVRAHENTAVVLAGDGTVVTVIRTRDGKRLRLLSGQ